MSMLFVNAGRYFGSRKYKLDLAITDGELAKAMRLVRADPTLCKVRYDSFTALHHASHTWHCEKNPGLVNLLIEAGADPNATDGDGSTPLFWASPHGHLNIVFALLKGGANPRWENTRGMTPLDCLLERNHGSDKNMIQVINLLCRHGGGVLSNALVRYEEGKMRKSDYAEWIKKNPCSAPDQHAMDHMRRY